MEILRRQKEIKLQSLESYLKQENIEQPPPHNVTLFQPDFDAKLYLLRLLPFLINLKDTIYLKEKQNFNKFQSDFDAKLYLLRLLPFLINLKSTIYLKEKQNFNK